MKFLADVMLQRLARWLRMLGISTEPAPSEDDDALIRHASDRNLNLLTRDKALFQKARNYCNAFLVESPELEKQILEVCKHFKIDLKKMKEKEIPSQKICSMCNGELKRASKVSIRGEVPSKSYKLKSKFWRCSSCKQIFWEGSHNEKILKKFRLLKTRAK